MATNSLTVFPKLESTENFEKWRNRGFEPVTTTYSNFKSNFKRLWVQIPVASSPITTRWQQSPNQGLANPSLGEESSTLDLEESVGSELRVMPEKDTLTLGSFEEPLKTPIKGSSETSNSALQFCKQPHVLNRGEKEDAVSKGQKCLNQLYLTRKMVQQMSRKMQLCEKSQCVWKGCKDVVRDESFHHKMISNINYPIYQPEVKIHLTGLQNDYYLNIVDWNLQNLVAIALGSAVYIWNGENHTGTENIDLSLTCNYVSSVSWIKEGTCLAVGTSEGEVQWVETGPCPPSRRSASMAPPRWNALKWSPDGRLLASGCSDRLLTIWPHHLQAGAQSQPLTVQPQPTAVKICSLIWLPETKAIPTGQGSPSNDVTLWTCPALYRSAGFFGHRSRVLHLALSPDQTRVFSAAADGTAYVWKCHQSPSSFQPLVSP